MSDPEDSRVGTVIDGRYRILERLDHGGMGVVYRAERVQLGRAVAIKLLHAVFAARPDFVRRFEREAKMMSRLDHPHCVSVIDFGVANGAYIVMEFVVGTTLKDLIDDVDEPMEPARAIRIMRQVLAGVAHAHEQGIVHRDVKPANIMLAHATGTGDHARILDFGLAKLCDPDQSMSTVMVGTPNYMPPEQSAGSVPDARGDLYACALVLFELLTLDRPFFADDPFEVIRMHREAPIPSLADKHRGAGFSPELESVVARALAKSPDDRFQTAAAMADALAAAPEADGAGDRPTAPARVASSVAAVDAAPMPRRRRPGQWAALAIVGLVCGGVAVWQSGWLERRARDAVSAVDQLRSRADTSGAAPSDVSVEAAESLIAAGNAEGAIRLLHEVRRQSPGAARPSFLLGGLYHNKGWIAESLAAYAEAIDKSPLYRKRVEITQRAIDALAEPATRNKAELVLAKSVGRPAVPALRRAARSHADRAVRDRAGKLADRIDASPR